MSNIAISEITTDAQSLDDNDYLLVSKANSGGSYTSARMLGSVLKGSIGTCQFNADTVKNSCKSAIDEKGVSTLTSSQVQTACENAITTKNISTLTSTQVQTACSSAISSSSTSVNVKGVFIDPSKFSDGYLSGTDSLSFYTLKYDSAIILNYFQVSSTTSCQFYINNRLIINSFGTYETIILYVKKDSIIIISGGNGVSYTICPLG